MHTGAREADASEIEGEAGPSGLRVTVLGPCGAVLHGAALDLGGPRQRAVLALLVIAHGDVVPAERLADSLWGAQPPAHTAGSLHAHVSHLRRRLEPDRAARARDGVIASAGSGYALRIPGDAVDAWRFEQLIQQAAAAPEPAAAVTMLGAALRLWRGPAFAEYAHEPWAEAEATRLERVRALAREQLVAARLAAGESAVLIPEIEALVAEQPLSEERWRLLVLASYRAHRQADALAALRRARKTLADELGVDPGPGLRELEAQVLAQSPTLDAPQPRVDSVKSPSPTPQARLPASRDPLDVLVDRDQELAELNRSLDHALSGQSRLVLIEGPAGIGKSRLLAEARHFATDRGALTLTARGSQMEKEYGFGAVRQLFEPALSDPRRRESMLAGAATSAQTVFDAVTKEPHQRADSSFSVLHGLYWLTVNLAADRPVVLAIDDLHWCDSGSLRFLAYLVHRLEGLPIAVVATVRTGEDHEDTAILEELAHDLAAVPVRPPPLTVDGVADLVRRRLGEPADDRFIRACHATTTGNPLLLRQLLRALEADRIRPDASHADTVTAIGSRAVSSIVLMRLRRMPPEITAVARAIAVLGEGAALPAIAALAGRPEPEVAAAIATLTRAEVVRDGYPVDFVHPLVGDAVYRDLSAAERALQHERAARILAIMGATPEQLAAHLLKGPQRGDAWVVEVLRRAAFGAADRGAPESATTYLTRALAEPPEPEHRPHVLHELGQFQAMSDGAAAVAPLRQAYAALTDPVPRAAVAQTLARTLVFVGPPGAATPFARQAAAELPPELVDERQGLIALERIAGFMHGLDRETYATGSEPVVVGDGPGARMLAADLAWEVLAAGTDRARAVELARFALADGVLLRHDVGLLWVVAGFVLDMADEGGVVFWDDALADAHARGSIFTALAAHLWRGYLLWQRGELREAYESLLLSSEQSGVWGASIGSPYTHAFTVGVLLDRADVAGARAFLERVRELPRAGDGLRLFADAEASVLIAEGRAAEALAVVDDAAGLMTSVVNPVWRPWRSLRARALAGLGRTAEAVTLVEEELRLARRWGTPSLVGRTLRLLGELRGAEGVPALRDAVALLAPSGARQEHARALCALATTLAPSTESVPLLRQAYAIADSCDALALRERIAEGMRLAGVDRPAEPDAAVSLTPAERRIAEMSVAGADENQIAQTLFVTPGSVRLTLESVCDRLCAESTAELRTALASA